MLRTARPEGRQFSLEFKLSYTSFALNGTNTGKTCALDRLPLLLATA